VAEIKSVAGTASFAGELLNHKEVRGLLSDEHFSVDGTQVAAWASMKSFRAKDGSDEPPSGGRNGEAAKNFVRALSSRSQLCLQSNAMSLGRS
jgi:hypothetical protein